MLNDLPPSPPSFPAEGGIVAPTRFREGMSRLVASVHVVATDGTAGRAGFTATAVAPVTDNPATLLVCINASGRTARALVRNEVFCVNALTTADSAVAETFARPGLTGEERFAVGRWGRLSTGAPFLETSLVAFDCRLIEADLVATHYVMIGAVADVRIGSVEPALVYRGRGYDAL